MRDTQSNSALKMAIPLFYLPDIPFPVNFDLMRPSIKKRVASHRHRRALQTTGLFLGVVSGSLNAIPYLFHFLPSFFGRLIDFFTSGFGRALFFTGSQTCYQKNGGKQGNNGFREFHDEAPF
jgi:hypothetical protein